MKGLIKQALPPQAGNSGKFLTTNGTIPSWGNLPSGQVAFSAYNSATQSNIGSDTDISFDTEDFDLGSNFSSSTFTAPSSGLYLFTGSVVIDRAGSSDELAIVIRAEKNGSDYFAIGGAHYHSTSDARNQGIGGAIIMQLSANDTIKLNLLMTIAVSSGGGAILDIIHGITQSRFTGVKLT